MISRVTPDLDLIGAYAYLNATVESGDNAGKRVETVPEQQASLWAKYRLTALGLQGVTVGGGVRYIGESWDGTDTIRTPTRPGRGGFRSTPATLPTSAMSTLACRAATASSASAAPCWGARPTGSSRSPE